MANLYYTNASTDGAWETLSNWNTAADGSGSIATDIPWDGNNGTPYSNYDLIDASGGDGVSLNAYIQGTITGICYIPNITSNSQVVIYTGTFAGINFTNSGFIFGGTFEITGFVGSVQSYPNINITSGGTPFTGTWSGQIWSSGVWVGVKNLYYTNASTDGLWETLSNWNTNQYGFGDTPTEIPWSGANGSTSASDLIDASGNAGVTLNSAIGSGVTGSCGINVSGYGQIIIDGGTFNGSVSSSNQVVINGGTFNSSVSIGSVGYITSGTFNSSVSVVASTTIIGGIFNGAVSIDLFSQIGGGTYNSSVQCSFESRIVGGTFEVTTATISNTGGYITWSSLLTISNGTPFTGVWSGQVWSGGVWVSAYTPPSGGGSNQKIARLLNLPWLPSGGGSNQRIARLLNLPWFINL